MKLKVAIPLLMVILAISAAVIIGLVIYNNVAQNIKTDNFRILQNSLVLKQKILLEYFNGLENSLKSISENSSVQQSYNSFKNAYLRLEKYKSLDPIRQAFLTHPTLKDLMGLKLPTNPAVYLYNSTHSRFYPMAKSYIQNLGLTDFILVDLKGNVIYTYSKDQDFATNLVNGKWKNSQLGMLYSNILKDKKDDIILSTINSYEPAKGKISLFIGKKMVMRNRPMGVVILRLPLNKIDGILNESTGMGKTGQTILIGEDHYLKNNLRFDKSSALKIKINTPQANLALEGKNGILVGKNYENKSVLAVYDFIKILNRKWGIISEINTSEAFSSLNKIRNITFIILGVSALVILVIAIFLSIKITKPIENLESTISKLSTGDLTVKFDIKGHSEIASMGTALAKTTESIKNTVVNIANSVDDIVEASNKVDSSSKESLKGMKDLLNYISMIGNNTRSTSAAIEETHASVTDIVQSAKMIAERSEQLDKNSGIVVDTATQGKKDIHDIVNTIVDVDEKVSEFSSELDGLNETTKNIGEIVKLIGGISEQTNLLALNAAIEAARAGEAGKGFAVIADEIRGLAEESKNATENIASMLNEIGKSVAETNSKSKIVGDSVKVATQKSKDIEKEFNTIFEEIKKVSENIQEIANATQQQSTTSSEIMEAMSNASDSVSEVANELVNANVMVQEELERSQNLQEVSTKLSELVKATKELIVYFKI